MGHLPIDIAAALSKMFVFSAAQYKTGAAENNGLLLCFIPKRCIMRSKRDQEKRWKQAA